MRYGPKELLLMLMLMITIIISVADAAVPGFHKIISSRYEMREMILEKNDSVTWANKTYVFVPNENNYIVPNDFIAVNGLKR